MSGVLSSHRKPGPSFSSSSSSGTANQDLTAQSLFAGAILTAVQLANIGFPKATQTQSFTTSTAHNNNNSSNALIDKIIIHYSYVKMMYFFLL